MSPRGVLLAVLALTLARIPDGSASAGIALESAGSQLVLGEASGAVPAYATSGGPDRPDGSVPYGAGADPAAFDELGEP